MGRQEEILAELEKLKSKEGYIQFIMTHTLLSRERVEAIDRVGSPWQVFLPTGFEDLASHINALQRGEITNKEGINHISAVDALTQMLDLEAKTKEEWEPDDRLSEYLKEIAGLSGETLDTINDFYWAHISYGQRSYKLYEEFKKLT